MTFKLFLPAIFINLFFMAVAIMAYSLLDRNVALLSAIIATGISISLGFTKLNIENDRIFKELFQEFNRQYDLKFNERLNEILSSYSINPEIVLSKNDKQLVVDYLNFCAEEYLWKTKGRIPDQIWKSWRNGMLVFLGNPLIAAVVAEERGSDDSYYGFLDYAYTNILDDSGQ